MRLRTVVGCRGLCGSSASTFALLGVLLAGCNGATLSTTDAGVDAGPDFLSLGVQDNHVDCPKGLSPTCMDDIYKNVAASIGADTSIFALASTGPLSRPQVEAALESWKESLNLSQDTSFELATVEQDLNLEAAYQQIEQQVFTDFNEEVDPLASGGEALRQFLFDLDQGAPPDGGVDLFGATALSKANAAVSFFVLDDYDVHLAFTPNFGVVDFSQSITLLFLAQSAYAPGTPLSPDAWLSTSSEVANLAQLVRTRANERCQEPPVSPLCASVSAHEMQVFAPSLDALATSLRQAASALPP
jgi:hypothetical protein